MNQNCPICEGRLVSWMTMPIDPKKETACAYGALYRCVDCSYGLVLPRPSPEEIGGFYELDRYYTHGRSHFAEPGRVGLLDRVRVRLAWAVDHGEGLNAAMIDELLGGRPGEICDIGCGGGDLARGLAEQGHQVVGVELDPNALRAAREAGLDVHEGSIERLPAAVADRRFDVVIMSHVLEHILDPAAAVQAASGLLKPGGRFVCVVPNNASAGLARTGVAWEPLDVPRHLNFFVPENLRTLCGRAGLATRRLFFCGYTRQFVNAWINTEARIYDAVVRDQGAPPAGLRRNSPARAWGLLARTALASPPTKYDQVGIIAERPPSADPA